MDNKNRTSVRISKRGYSQEPDRVCTTVLLVAKTHGVILVRGAMPMAWVLMQETNFEGINQEISLVGNGNFNCFAKGAKKAGE